MYDEVVEEATSLSWSETISAEDSAEVAKFNLIPDGKYPSILVNATRELVNNERSPFHGKVLGRGDFVLNGDGRDYHLFIDLYPGIVTAKTEDGREYLTMASQQTESLMAALEMIGQPFEQVLEKAAQTTLQATIRITKPRDKAKKPRNVVKFSAYKG